MPISQDHYRARDPDPTRHDRRRTRRQARGSSPSPGPAPEDSSLGGGGKAPHRELELDPAALRRVRIERLEGRREIATAIATADINVIASATPSANANVKVGRDNKPVERYNMTTDTQANEGRRRTGHRDEEKRPRRKKRDGEGEEAQYVYGAPAPAAEKKAPTVRVSETRRLGRDGESEEEIVTRSRTVRDRPKERKIRVVYMTREEMKAKNKEPRVKSAREERPRESETSLHRSRTHKSRRGSVAEAPSLTASPPKRHASTRVAPPEARPALKRSNTTTSHVPSTRSHIPSAAGASPTAKRSSFMGSFFGPGIQQHHEPEKLVECLTCLSDDVPRSKSAKLKCGHRMCHSCLKRIFRLSVNDPQHMPPKCCTADHIPLKHVEKLFDINFKKNWNKKFQEFSTKNRVYCPARRCGEWIKPGNMHKEDGKKYGKCGRCRTKVCCLCNGRWHGMKDCPKDEETNRLLETAKQAGWQRCYSCRTMVELKEGCNHMTCHCRAEFCMICGLKWKSCNCPWFNYEAVEEDRLNHMQIPRARHPEMPLDQNPNLNPIPNPPNRLHRPRPPTYNEELTARQRQERRDEALARRMQRAALNDPPNNNDHDEDYQGGIGDIHGVGNGAAHFMNQDYVRAAHNILTGDFRQANRAADYVMGVREARRGGERMGERVGERQQQQQQAAPPLRRHTLGERVYNDTLPRERAAERIVPRRTRVDYEGEAAVHAPLGSGSGLGSRLGGREPPRPPPRVPGVRLPRSSRGERDRDGEREGEREREREPRHSVLAGLGGRGNRVSAWRSHIEPGVVPEEGVISPAIQGY